MKLKEFGYTLPEHLIAQSPVRPRDKARLMVVHRKTKKITHDVFSNLGNYLPASSTLVLNDSKVVPVRLLGKRQTGAEVEFFLLKKLADGYSFEALIRPLKKVKVDEKILFNGQGIYAQVKDKENRIVRFNKKNIAPYLERIGHMPLPPYIKRPDQKIDRRDYQTVYARKSGSVASPTAGLHFTQGLLDKLVKQGHHVKKVTLHVNYATFKPVEEDDVRQHKMHEEEYSVAAGTYRQIKSAREKGKKVVAVGTTSCRVLETAATTGRLKGSTDIFMYPGYTFKSVDILVTNFHLPFSTLLMLVYAFGGAPLIKKAYQEAIKEKYRFYSYGDAMIIL